MNDVDEMELADIEKRLDDLEVKKADVSEFHDLVGETADNLAELAGYEFLDESASAKLQFLKTMLNWTTHHDVNEGHSIRYEREVLRRRRHELKHGYGDGDE